MTNRYWKAAALLGLAVLSNARAEAADYGAYVTTSFNGPNVSFTSDTFGAAPPPTALEPGTYYYTTALDLGGQTLDGSSFSLSKDVSVRIAINGLSSVDQLRRQVSASAGPFGNSNGSGTFELGEFDRAYSAQGDYGESASATLNSFAGPVVTSTETSFVVTASSSLVAANAPRSYSGADSFVQIQLSFTVPEDSLEPVSFTTTVPEPASLMAGAAVVVGLLRRRRRVAA